MSLEYIYITRHGFRSNWVVNPATGDYTGFVRSPTGHPADPALTSHGVSQSLELAAHLTRRLNDVGMGARPIPVPVERIYSSPYYRCLQTIQPFVEKVSRDDRQDPVEGSGRAAPPWWAVRCEPGLVDWFGPAPFEQPQPAPLRLLHDEFFPWIDLTYADSGIVPLRNGESMAQLHARVAATLGHIIRQCDAEGVRAIVLCAHAATNIAMGRALTGELPVDVETEDFGAFTCGLSTFRRRHESHNQFSHQLLPQQQTGQRLDRRPVLPSHQQRRNAETASPSSAPSPTILPSHVPPWDDQFHTLAGEVWIGGRGVEGGWNCEENCDCSFLSEGEERGWRFSGDDEAFAGAALSATVMSTKTKGGRHIVDAGLELGITVEGGGRVGKGQKYEQGRESKQGRQRSAEWTLAKPEPLRDAEGDHSVDGAEGSSGGGGEAKPAGSSNDANGDDKLANNSDTSAGIGGGKNADSRRHGGRRGYGGGDDHGGGGGRGSGYGGRQSSRL